MLLLCTARKTKKMRNGNLTVKWVYVAKQPVVWSTGRLTSTDGLVTALTRIPAPRPPARLSNTNFFPMPTFFAMATFVRGINAINGGQHLIKHYIKHLTSISNISSSISQASHKHYIRQGIPPANCWLCRNPDNSINLPTIRRRTKPHKCRTDQRLRPLRVPQTVTKLAHPRTLPRR